MGTRTRILLGALCATLALAQEPVSMPQIMTDGAGYNWDIQQGGTVSDGTSDAYDGAMMINLNGVNPPMSPMATMHESRRAFSFVIEGAMMGLPEGLTVTRWVYVPDDIGCAVWLDVLENNSTEEITLSYGLRSDFGSDGGTEIVTTSSGDTTVDESDWAAITDDQFGGSDPALTHIWGVEESDTRPAVSLNNGAEVLTYTMADLSLAAGEVIAVAYVEAQRRSREEAEDFLENFDPSVVATLAEMAEAAPINFGLGRRSASLLRGEGADVLELLGGDFLAGTIKVESYPFSSAYGSRTIPAEEVASVVFGDLGEDRVFLISGEILIGTLDLPGVGFETAEGRLLNARREVVSRIGYRKRDDEPTDALEVKTGITTKQGAVYSCEPASGTLPLQTVYGAVEIPWDKIARIDLGEQLHTVSLVGGSRLSGVLQTRELSFEGSYSFTFPTAALVSIVCRDEQPDASNLLTRVSVRNGDMLAGTTGNASITVQTALGELELGLAEVERIERDARQPGVVSVLLRRSGAVRGRWLDSSLALELAEGVSVTLLPGDCLWAEFPAPKAPPELLEEIASQIKDLYSDDYQLREAAAERLREIGEAALPALYREMESTEDLEVRLTCSELITEIE